MVATCELQVIHHGIISTNQASLSSFFFKQKVHANPLGAFTATIFGSDSSEREWNLDNMVSKWLQLF